MRFPWPSRRREHDPYWERFIHRAPADPNNLITHAFKAVKPGGVNPVRGEIHSPDVMTSHVKELGRFFGADQVAVVQLGHSSELPFAIVCGLRSEYDTRTTPGVGGQAPALKGLFVSFNLVAYIKELGYRASRSMDDAERLAVIGSVGRQGPELHIAEVIRTDLPLQPDIQEQASV